MRERRLMRWLGAVGVAVLAAACGAQEIVNTPAKAGGVYDVGEKIAWKVDVKNGSLAKATYTIKKGGLTVMKEGEIDLSSGSASIETQLDEPGAVLVEIKAKGANAEKPLRHQMGAVVAPEKIKPSMAKPDDFDDFWKKKVEQLHAIPTNAKVEPAEGGKAGVEYFKVTMDNINGSHIYGQLAKPAKEGKYPALLLVQYASVYPLKKEWATGRGAQGWLTLNIMAHDLPFDRPEEFYKTATNTTHKDYVAIGDEDRETSYFLRMYLSCYRAVDYLSERPDWDGKTIVVMGTSQGGQQSFVTAGFHPKITAMIANVPAGCDVTGPTVGRAAGFPYWADRARWKKKPQIVEVGRYFDAMNFAAGVKCPALVGVGLIDETCPPSGVYAAFNQFGGPKEILPMVNSDHKGQGNSQAVFYKRSEAWLAKLVKGEAPPAGSGK